jgi:hypothetical protein
MFDGLFTSFRSTVPSHDLLMKTAAAYQMLNHVEASIERLILAQTAESPKLYMLHDRLETDKKGEKHAVASKLRGYLKNVANRKHRVALTRLLVSNHCYAIETLRYSKIPVPREERMCRFCSGEVESPEHVLLACRRNGDILRLRAKFLETLLRQGSQEQHEALRRSDGDPRTQLKFIVFGMPGTIPQTAKYVYDVKDIVQQTEYVSV